MDKLLERYVNIIKTMAKMRHPDTAALYFLMDQKRKEIHEEILRETCKTRDDKEFALELAEYVEQFLSE